MNNNPIRISPRVHELGVEAINSHISNLISAAQKSGTTPHDEILQKLLGQFRPLDFEALVYPDIEGLRKRLEQLDPGSQDAKDILKQIGNFKLNLKHYLVLSIENTLKLAKMNHWGLCKNHDFIYLYNRSFWSEIDKEVFQKFLGEAAEQMGVTKFSARFYQFREQLYKQFLATAYLPAPESNRDKVLINLLNGTFEITTNERRLRQFDSSDFITYQLPFEYNRLAKAPLFERYLNRVLPDKQSQRVLAEYLGYVFIKHDSDTLKEEKALILCGNGANGKSVFFEIVNALLGADNVSCYSLQSLTNDNGYFRAKLFNKLVNYASEISGRLEASLFKQLVSGEPVEARLPYGQPFMLKQYAKLMFNVNELPKDVEHSNAYFRRFLIIPFDVSIPEHEQDKRLHTKIIEKELSGVFNWVLEGLDRLIENQRFSPCDAAQKALEKYKSESNSIKLFLDDNNYEKSSTGYSLIKDIYPEYRTFCVDDGMKPFNKRNFIRQLENMGYHKSRESGTGQYSVNIKQKDEAF